MRLVAVLNVLSRVLLLFAASMALPWGLSYALGDGAQQAFGHALAATLASALVLWLITFHERRELQVRDGFLLVALVWTVLPAFATLPLLIYLPELNFTDAYFETVAALTTTGSTVLSGLDKLPPSINFWRCQLQWLGGMGTIVLAVAVLPLLGIGGGPIMRAQSPGGVEGTKTTPRITEKAQRFGVGFGDHDLGLRL